MRQRRDTIVLATLVLLLAAPCARDPDRTLSGTAGRGGTGPGRGGASGSAGTGSSGSGGSSAGGTGQAGTGTGGAGQGGAGRGGIGDGGQAGPARAARAAKPAPARAARRQAGTGAGGTGGQGGSGRGGTAGIIGPGSGVLQHHNHASRDGVYVDAALTKTAVATMHLDPTFVSPSIDGAVFAQPLYLDGVGGKPDLVFVVTKTNHVYALNAATGAIAWDVVVGTLGVRPSTVCTPGPVGIIGTPIIDGGRRIIYVDALVAVAGGPTAGPPTSTWCSRSTPTPATCGRVGRSTSTPRRASARWRSIPASRTSAERSRCWVERCTSPTAASAATAATYHGWVVGIATRIRAR